MKTQPAEWPVNATGPSSGTRTPETESDAPTAKLNRVSYPARIGLAVRCDRPARQSPTWLRFQGKTGVVTHNHLGEIAVELDGQSGTTYWFNPNEIVKSDGGQSAAQR